MEITDGWTLVRDPRCCPHSKHSKHSKHQYQHSQRVSTLVRPEELFVLLPVSSNGAGGSHCFVTPGLSSESYGCAAPILQLPNVQDNLTRNEQGFKTVDICLASLAIITLAVASISTYVLFVHPDAQ